MALSFLYRLIRRVIEVVRVHRMDAAAKDAELLAADTQELKLVKVEGAVTQAPGALALPEIIP